MPTNLKRLILISISILLRCLGRETPLHAKISDPNTEVRAIKMPKKSTIDFQNIYCTVTFTSKPPLKNMNQLFPPHKQIPILILFYGLKVWNDPVLSCTSKMPRK